MTETVDENIHFAVFLTDIFVPALVTIVSNQDPPGKSRLSMPFGIRNHRVDFLSNYG
jgi:hypothetical protein